MQPFEIVDVSHMAQQSSRSCLHRPAAEFVQTTSSNNHSSRRGNALVANASEKRNSPMRSPQRAASPSRAVVAVGASLASPHGPQATTQACSKAIRAAGGRLLQPLVSGGEGGGNVGSRCRADEVVAVELDVYAPLSESNDVGGTLRRPESPVSEGMQDDLPGTTAHDDAGVVAREYLVVCDDIKRIVQEREETFPRCDRIPQIARLPAAILERLAPLDEAQRAETTTQCPSSSTSRPCLVSAQVGRVVVSECFPSAARCVIPHVALQELLMAHFLPSERGEWEDDDVAGEDDDGDVGPIWMSESAHLVVDLGRLRTPLRQLKSGAAQPVQFRVPFYVEDVGNIVLGPSGEGAPGTTLCPHPLRSPLYGVDVVIGEHRDLKPHAQKQPHAAAKKLHSALQHSERTHNANHNANQSPEKKCNNNAAPTSGVLDRVVHEETLTALRTLPSLPVHSFRPLPEMIACAHVGHWLLLTQPMMTLRSTTEVSERTMLRKGLLVLDDASNALAAANHPPQQRIRATANSTCLSSSEATAAVSKLMTQLESALALQSPIGSVVQPILHQLIPLLSNIGGPDALEKAMSLSRLRVQLQCRLIGISEAAIVEPAQTMPIQALAGVLDAASPTAHGDDVDAALPSSPSSTLTFVAALLHDNVSAAEAMLQYVVECAHLTKHCGRFRDARLWYRVGIVLTSLLRSGVTAHHHNRGAAGGVGGNTSSSMVRGDETALLPFLQAVGDVSVSLGCLDDAIAAYEIGRALAEMADRLAPSSSSHDRHGSSTPLLQLSSIKVLEFDAAIAVAATMAHRPQAAQTAFLRCSKALEDAVHTLPLQWQRCGQSLGGRRHGGGTTAMDGDAEAAGRVVAAIEAAVDVYCHLAYCCLARDALQQATKMLDDATQLLDVVDDAHGGADAPQPVPPTPSVRHRGDDALIILRGNVAVLCGWSALRSLMVHPDPETVMGSQQSSSPPPSPPERSSSSRRRVTLPSGDAADSMRGEPGSIPTAIETTDVDGQAAPDEEEAAAGVSANASPLGRAKRWFDSAVHLYHHGGSMDARLLIAAAQWLGHVCCSERLDGCDAIDAAARAVSVPQHPLGVCLSATVVYLRAAELKQNQRFLDDVEFATQVEAQIRVIKATQSVLVGAAAPDVKPLADHHPLAFFVWEMAAVSCALVGETSDACHFLDMAAAVFVANQEDGLTSHTSTMGSPHRGKTAVAGAGDGGDGDGRQLGCMPTFLRRDASLMCRRLAPLCAYCFTLAEHNSSGHGRNPPAASSTTPSVSVARAERMVLELIHDVGLDSVQANQRSGGGRSSPVAAKHLHGRSSSGAGSAASAASISMEEVPSIFLDAAELRMCQGDYLSCLEGCGRAVRLADERNLLYLLGPLFNPSFQLSPTDVEDRSRLLRDRRVETTTNGAMLGLALFTMARCHERSGNFKQALTTYQQCFASTEMTGMLRQPVATEALIGCARVSLNLGVIGDGQMYADVAHELFETFHGAFGAYRGTPQLVALRSSIDHCRRTADRLSLERHYRLAAHEELYASPSLNGFPLYL